MDEALRRAYLAAMDIPVWIPRGAEDPVVVAEVAPAPAARQVAREQPSRPPAGGVREQPARSGRGQALLDEKPSVSGTSPHRAQPPAAPGSGERFSFTFGFVRFGNTLLIDERQLAPRGEELARAICFAVEQSKSPPASQDFTWPPRGAPFVAAEARDAMLARIDKFGGGTLQRILLLGASPVSVLMGWDTAQWTARTHGVHHIDGLDCAIFLLPGLSAMLADADAKRLAWQHLRDSGTGNG